MRAPRTVTLDQRGLLIDGEPTPLVAGTLEYWRNISLNWRKCLEAVQGAGVDVISTFVCWDFHQLGDGSLDFTGRTHPSRDLAGFLDLCEEMGLDVMLRLGPIIDAEWPTRGPAEDVCQLERIDPRYRERVEEYLAAVLEVVVPRLATKGGPVIMVSVDNEPYVPYATDEESDPSEGSVPIPYDRERVLGAYGEWLERKYGDEEGLREAWGTAEASLSSPREPAYGEDGDLRVLDSFDFITDTIADIYAWMVGFCREHGVDVPIYSNMKPLSHYVDWQRVEQEVDGHGLGIFMSDMLPDDQALVASWYVRLERARTRFPWAAEFQSMVPMGQEEVFGVISDRHQRYLTELALAMGLRGLAYYVMVERDDALGCPISPLGKIRPRLAEVAEAVKMARSVGADEQVAPIGLLWTHDHHRLEIAGRFDTWTKLFHVWIGMDQPQDLPGWWGRFGELHREDADFAILPMREAAAKRVLVYGGAPQVRVDELQPVVEAVEAGATLLAEALPERAIEGSDEALAALNRRLEESGRLVLLGSGPLRPELERLGATGPVSSGHPGVWTSAYLRDGSHHFFVANTTDEEAEVDVALDEDLAVLMEGREAVDPVTGERLVISGGHLLGGPARLGAKSVRSLVVHDEKDG